MTLTCTKTGRWWPVATVAHGDMLARQLGLKDYTVEVTRHDPR